MKIFEKVMIPLLIVFIYQISLGQTIESYIQKAESFNQAGNLEQAAKIMEEAIQKFPNNSTAHSYLGLYRGSQAGRTQNYMQAGQLIQISYQMLDKAVALDPNNPIARFHRGLMGVEVPPFINRLDQGLEDLELLRKMYQKSPDKISAELMANAYNFLGLGYQKKQDNQKAIAAWEKVIEFAPETTLAQNAQKNITKLTQPKVQAVVEQKKYTSQDVDKIKQQLQKEPQNPILLTQLGQAFIDIEQFEEAEKVLEKAIQIDSTNVAAYNLLIEVIGERAAKGYDERIYDDTDLRTKLAFRVAELADKVTEIAPDDLEARLVRGSIGVMMPFFVERLEQAIEDLNLVINGDVPAEMKAEAIYWLGFAHQKKATTHWIDVITHYPETNASKLAFASMRPAMQHFDATQYQKPFLAIDFVLGFRDELSPQTAVWIEDTNGKFIKTVYVSGFSGFAKEMQANLSEWAESSDFKDVDGVTGASIDVGHHIYVWDLLDHQGKTYKSGEFVIKIETAYWPSMEYQFTSAKIKIGENNRRVVVEEGNIIPYLEVKYFSE
jgi:tetratricopeptide (TPR) repeat protein